MFTNDIQNRMRVMRVLVLLVAVVSAAVLYLSAPTTAHAQDTALELDTRSANITTASSRMTSYCTFPPQRINASVGLVRGNFRTWLRRYNADTGSPHGEGVWYHGSPIVPGRGSLHLPSYETAVRVLGLTPVLEQSQDAYCTRNDELIGRAGVQILQDQWQGWGGPGTPLSPDFWKRNYNTCSWRYHLDGGPWWSSRGYREIYWKRFGPLMIDRDPQAVPRPVGQIDRELDWIERGMEPGWERFSHPAKSGDPGAWDICWRRIPGWSPGRLSTGRLEIELGPR